MWPAGKGTSDPWLWHREVTGMCGVVGAKVRRLTRGGWETADAGPAGHSWEKPGGEDRETWQGLTGAAKA